MQFKIYQINSERQEKKPLCQQTLFEDYDPKKFDVNDYDLVYEGKILQDNLDYVFEKFNIDRPSDFTGHSLSVSDIIEVTGSSLIMPGYYYVAKCGYVNIDKEFKNGNCRPC